MMFLKCSSKFLNMRGPLAVRISRLFCFIAQILISSNLAREFFSCALSYLATKTHFSKFTQFQRFSSASCYNNKPACGLPDVIDRCYEQDAPRI